MCDISTAVRLYQKSLSVQKDEKIEEKLNKLLLYKGMLSLENGEYSNILLNYYQGAKLERIKQKQEIQEKIKLEEEEQERIRILKEKELNSKNKKKKKKQNSQKSLEEEIKQEEIRSKEIERLKAIKVKLVLPIHQKFFIQGMCFLSISYLNFAQTDFQKSAEYEPQFIDALLFQAKIYKIQGRINDANQVFWKIYNINNHQPEIKEFIKIAIPEAESYFQSARKNLLENNASKSMFLVNKGLRIHPTHTNLLLLRAFLQRRLENYEESLCDLELAYRNLKDQNQEYDIRNQIGHTYNEMGRHLYLKQKYDESKTIFTEALLFKPDDWGILLNRGDCYFELKQDDQALEDYLKAYEIIGKNEEALSEFTQAIEFNPKSDLAFVQRGKCEVESGSVHLARKDFQTAFRLNPDNQHAKKFISLLEKGEKTNFTSNFKKQKINL